MAGLTPGLLILPIAIALAAAAQNPQELFDKVGLNAAQRSKEPPPLPERMYVLSAKFDRIERGGASQPVWLIHPYARGPMPPASLATPRSARQAISVPNVSRAASFVVEPARLRQSRLTGEWKTVEGPSEPVLP